MNREPIPPIPSRADVFGQLRRERWFAADAGETARVEQIDREIERLSAAGTAVAPTRETAAVAPSRTSATRNTTTKGQRRVAAR